MATTIDTIEGRLSRPGSLAGTMQRHVLQVLQDHYDADEIPTNGRFVFYELEGRGIVRKSNQGESRRGTKDDPREQEVAEALSEVRKRSIIPWSWIVDETRHLVVYQHAPSIYDGVDRFIDTARINPWDGPPPVLLVESRSLGGVLRPLARRYVIPIAPTNGQVGGFLHTDIVPLFQDNDRPCIYLGDWDHQGHQIEANTRSVLEREAGRHIEWTRIAITEEQIEERGLTPVWKKDHRYKPAKVGPAWETEALGQSTVVRLVREALDGLLPQPLDDVLELERAQREEIRERLEVHR